jgi:hypothetical protein
MGQIIDGAMRVSNLTLLDSIERDMDEIEKLNKHIQFDNVQITGRPQHGDIYLEVPVHKKKGKK